MTRADPWTTLRVLDWTAERFARAGFASPRLDAELLLAHALGCERIRLYMDHDKPLAEAELARARDLVRRRLAREPVAYIIGRREFWSLALEVTPAVLIPRPESELLVEVALALARPLPAPEIVDVGTGSGAVALALARELPAARLWALDRSPAALAVARANGSRLGLATSFLESDLLAALPAALTPDLIVANLPYVPSDELARLEPEVRDWEPRAALDGGRDGLDEIRRLLPQAARALRPGGWLALEHGAGQAPGLCELLAANGFEAPARARDLAGHERVVSARLPE